jgi:hypothetical protein
MKRRQTVSLLPLLPVAVIVLVATAFHLSGDGSYRYPCQDPSNFTNPSCQRPACIAAETCTDMLIDLGETK